MSFRNTLNSPNIVGEISVGHTNFLVKVGLTWVERLPVFLQAFIKTSDQHTKY